MKQPLKNLWKKTSMLVSRSSKKLRSMVKILIPFIFTWETGANYMTNRKEHQKWFPGILRSSSWILKEMWWSMLLRQLHHKNWESLWKLNFWNEKKIQKMKIIAWYRWLKLEGYLLTKMIFVFLNIIDNFNRCHPNFIFLFLSCYYFFRSFLKFPL